MRAAFQNIPLNLWCMSMDETAHSTCTLPMPGLIKVHKGNHNADSLVNDTAALQRQCALAQQHWVMQQTRTLSCR